MICQLVFREGMSDEKQDEMNSAIKVLFGPFNVGIDWRDERTVEVQFESELQLTLTGS